MLSKKILTIVMLMIMLISAKAQNMSINSTGAEPDSSAMLDISATDKGMLIPRMKLSQRNAIPNPADGLMIFQVDGSKGIWVYDTATTNWNRLLDSTSISTLASVLAAGNDAGGDSILNLNALAVGVSAANSPLHVKSGGANSVGIRLENGANTNALIQLGEGNSGHANLIMRDLNGEEKIHLAAGSADSYFYGGGQVGIGITNPSNDFVVMDSTANSSINVATNNSGSHARLFLSTTERQWRIYNDGTSESLVIRDETAGNNRMVIDSLGNVGIGTGSPDSVLDVVGSATIDKLNINSVFTFPTVDGAVNQVMQTDGAGNLSWVNQGVGSSPWTLSGGTVSHTNSQTGVGTTSVDPEFKMEVELSGGSLSSGLFIDNQATGSSQKFGVKTMLSASGNAEKFGYWSRIQGKSSSADSIISFYSTLLPQNAGTRSFGFCSKFEASVGTTYGFYSEGEDQNYFSGNLGLGTLSPVSLLHVSGNTTIGNAFTPGTDNDSNIVNIISGSNANGLRNGITFHENTSAGGMAFGYDGTGSGDDNKLAVYADDGTENVVFEHGGNVGISVANPDEKLEVGGAVILDKTKYDNYETSTGNTNTNTTVETITIDNTAGNRWSMKLRVSALSGTEQSYIEAMVLKTNLADDVVVLITSSATTSAGFLSVPSISYDSSTDKVEIDQVAAAGNSGATVYLIYFECTVYSSASYPSFD